MRADSAPPVPDRFRENPNWRQARWKGRLNSEIVLGQLYQPQPIAPLSAKFTMLAGPHYDPLLPGFPLRQRGVCIVIDAMLLVVLAFAALIQLSVLASMPPEVALVFLR